MGQKIRDKCEHNKLGSVLGLTIQRYMISENPVSFSNCKGPFKYHARRGEYAIESHSVAGKGQTTKRMSRSP